MTEDAELIKWLYKKERPERNQLFLARMQRLPSRIPNFSLIRRLSMSSTRTQAEVWQAPKPMTNAPVLKVVNSLTRTKTELIPLKPNQLNWYTCGPTVYDDSHMGHARNYVTQDIIRRILRDYFGYNIHFVMNITDIDDKVSSLCPWHLR